MNYKFKIYILDEIYICHTLKKKKNNYSLWYLA